MFTVTLSISDRPQDNIIYVWRENTSQSIQPVAKKYIVSKPNIIIYHIHSAYWKMLEVILHKATVNLN